MPKMAAARFVFIDETAAKTDLTRTLGNAPRGQRLTGAAPYGHWHTTTFVGALRADRFIAPMVIDGAVNGELFLAYVEMVLAPRCGPATCW